MTRANRKTQFQVQIINIKTGEKKAGSDVREKKKTLYGIQQQIMNELAAQHKTFEVKIQRIRRPSQVV